MGIVERCRIMDNMERSMYEKKAFKGNETPPVDTIKAIWQHVIYNRAQFESLQRQQMEFHRFMGTRGPNSIRFANANTCAELYFYSTVSVSPPPVSQRKSIGIKITVYRGDYLYFGSRQI
jgi:hypothetical protein